MMSGEGSRGASREASLGSGRGKRKEGHKDLGKEGGRSTGGVAKGEVDLLRWVMGNSEKEVGRQGQMGVVPWGGGWGRTEKQH